MIGEYKISLWRTDDEKRHKLKLKNAISEKDYYIKCLPAQVQLAEKMRSRGKPVSHGTRLEYLILTDGSVFCSTKAKQYEKIESVEYYKDHSEVLKIDYLYYIEAISKSLDQVLNVVHKTQNFTFNQFKYRLQKLKVQEELLNYFKPNIIFK
jgi:DNA polymerase elongation subunit (family B)